MRSARARRRGAGGVRGRRRPRRAEAGPARARRRPEPARAGQPRDRRPPAAGQGRGRQAGGGGPAGRYVLRWRRGRPSSRPSATNAVLVEEAVDVTLPARPQAARRPAPAHHADRAHRRRLRRDGLRGRRRPRGRGGVAQLRRAQHSAPTTRRARCRTRSSSSPPTAGLVLRTHTSPVQIRTMLDPRAADLRRLPGAGVPHRRARRDAHPGLPPGRGAGRRRGPHDGRPQGHPRPLRRRDVRPEASSPGCARRTSRSPSPAPRSTSSASSAVARPSATPRTRAAPAPARAGSSGAAAAWSTRACCSACGIDPDRYSGFAFGMGIERTLMFRHGVATCATWSRATSASPRPSAWRSDARPAVAGCASTSTSRSSDDRPRRSRPGWCGSASRSRPSTTGDVHRPARRRSGAVARRRAAEERQDDPLVPGRRRWAQRRGRRARHRLRRPRTSPSATSWWSRCPGRSCPAASRSPRARPTAMSATA